MMIWLQIKRWFAGNLLSITGTTLFLFIISYVVLCWFFLWLTGEHAITDSFSHFVYYLAVTASTVGYGDMSPVTKAGRWVVALFVIPGGLSLFAALLGKLASVSLTYWRAGLLGKRSVFVQNHILLLGWNGQRTLDLIRMLQHEETGRRPIVLCCRSDIENPLPGEIEFVRVTSYTDRIQMEKTQLNSASCILIDNPQDDVTLSAALFCANYNPKAHLLAYFHDDALSELLLQHCPNAECIPAVDAEMLAKAAVDPGSSALHQELLSTTQGMTQYATHYPSDHDDTTIGALFMMLKQQYQATLIAVDHGGGINLNPDLKEWVKAGDKLFYIADERIDTIDWSLAEATAS